MWAFITWPTLVVAWSERCCPAGLINSRLIGCLWWSAGFVLLSALLAMKLPRAPSIEVQHDAQCEVTAKRASGAALGVFERYLTVWCFCASSPVSGWVRACRRFSQCRPYGSGARQSAGGDPDLFDDHSDVAEDRSQRDQRRASALAWCGGDAVRELGVKPFSMALLPGCLSAICSPYLPPSRSILHRRPQHPGRRSVHGDGVRLEPSYAREPHFTLSQVASTT